MLSEIEKRNRYFKELINNLEHDKALQSVIREIKAKLRLNWDRVIAVTGYEGTGKSSLALYLAYLLSDEFDIDGHLSLIPDAEEIKRKFKSVSQYGVYVIDEAVKALHKQDWHNKLQQTLIKMYATERWQNKVTIVVMPRFSEFTENFRNHRIKLWFHVFARDDKAGRATACLYVKDDRDKDSPDPWHIKENYKLKTNLWKGQHIADISTDQVIRAEEKTKNFLLSFTYPRLPKEIEDKYTDLKVASRSIEYTDLDDDKQRLIQAHKEREALWKARISLAIIRLRQPPYRLTVKAIGELLKVEHSTIKLWLKETKLHEKHGLWVLEDDTNSNIVYENPDLFTPNEANFIKVQNDKPLEATEGVVKDKSPMETKGTTAEQQQEDKD